MTEKKCCQNLFDFQPLKQFSTTVHCYINEVLMYFLFPKLAAIKNKLIYYLYYLAII